MEDGTKEPLWMMVMFLEVWKMRSVELIVLHKVGVLFQKQEIMTKNTFQWRA